jgi:hypothetical protein
MRFALPPPSSDNHRRGHGKMAGAFWSL